MSEQINQQQNPAKFAFFYLLSLVALIFTALSTGNIIFQIINKKIVEAATLPGGYDPGTLKFAIAAIIIATPVYYWMTWLINKSLFSGDLERHSGVRRWLAYLILFISSVVVIGWMIAIIFNFLDGELTLKFGLKALTAIIISATIFSYYFIDIRREETVGVKNKFVKIYGFASVAAIVVTLISSFFFVESPALTRNLKMDDAVLAKFEMIDSAVNNYYLENRKIPNDLEILVGVQAGYYITADDLVDPTSKEKFEYKATGKTVYELCANFRVSNKDLKRQNIYNPYSDRWPHESGKQCLPQKVRPEIIKDAIPVPTKK